MSLYDGIRADIDDHIDRLRESYGNVPVERTTVENGPDRFERGRELAERGWRGDAGAWVEDPDGRVLLIRHEDAGDEWGVPGGGHEPGERFDETARREVHEETGIEVVVDGVMKARRKRIVHAEEPDRCLEMLTVWFDARTDERSPTPAIGDDEIVAARWFDDVPGNVVDFLADRVDE